MLELSYNSNSKSSFIAQKVEVIPLEVVVRNIAYGSICKQTNIKPGTVFKEPLIDFYYKDDALNDPLLTLDRIMLMSIIGQEEIIFIKELTNKINLILQEFFANVSLALGIQFLRALFASNKCAELYRRKILRPNFESVV